MQFRRTDQSDNATEILTIVTLSDALFCEWTEQEHALGVQVTREDGDLVGVYDLDGAILPDVFTIGGWEVAEDETIPAAVVDAVSQGWERGSCVVARLA